MREGAAAYRVVHNFSFESAHQLPGHATCGVVHGHSYRGEIRVSAERLTAQGFVIEFGDLKAVTKLYDHAGILTRTAEALAEEIGRAVLARLSSQDNAASVLAVEVVLWETPNSRAEWSWHVSGQ